MDREIDEDGNLVRPWKTTKATSGSNDGLDGLTGREIISMLRNMPTKCDVCDQPKKPEELDPVSGGEWICHECWAAECKHYDDLPD